MNAFIDFKNLEMGTTDEHVDIWLNTYDEMKANSIITDMKDKGTCQYFIDLYDDSFGEGGIVS
jgi:hypothetical protein